MHYDSFLLAAVWLCIQVQSEIHSEITKNSAQNAYRERRIVHVKKNYRTIIAQQATSSPLGSRRKRHKKIVHNSLNTLMVMNFESMINNGARIVPWLYSPNDRDSTKKTARSSST